MSAQGDHIPDGYDAFALLRAKRDFADASVGESHFPMILGYQELKAAARNWRAFSSDAPFRIPIPEEQDVRDVAQLPIESDPPLHTEYRALMEPTFGRTAMRVLRPQLEVMADSLLGPLVAAGGGDVVSEFAVPFFLRALAVTMGRPAGDATEWMAWGTEVFSTDPETERRVGNPELDGYLAKVVSRAFESGGEDFFGRLAGATIEGRRITRDEVMGFGYLAFAGGRQTVVYTISNIFGYLSSHGEAIGWLRNDQARIPVAVEEFLRFMTPITHIGRVVRGSAELDGRSLGDGQLISLCFASANRDSREFEAADVCDLSRAPNRHVAFGHGPHTCLGAPMARTLLEIVLGCICRRVGSIRVVGAPEPRFEDVGCASALQGFTGLRAELESV